MPCTVGSD
uniref:Uncharacterized protein n=1 Tax=Anguilla anguilla TaxID=7936 RepID=A0A0E9QFN0_ANGAN